MSLPSTDGPLDFDDWLARRGNTVQFGWIIVGQIWKEGSTHASTYTYLVDSDRTEERLRSEPSGCNSLRTQTEIVESFLERRAYGEGAHEDGDEPVGPDKYPLVVETMYHGYRPTLLDFVQPFTLYWNAWWEGEVLRRVDDGGIVHEIGRRTRERENVRLEVDAHHLRLFLAVSRHAAFRIHDHRRFARDDGHGAVDKSYEDETGHFHVVVAKADWLGDDKFFGSVMGKDVIYAYRHVEGDPRESDWTAERFVVGRAGNGTPLEVSSGTDALALLPVYFRPEVLRRYYDAPDRYRFENGALVCLDRWSVRFERRADDLVEVYLVDLSHIPNADQKHFRAFNVSPPGTGISEERFRRDFMAQWINPQNDPVFDFNSALRDVNLASSDVLGAPLFRPLTDADAHVIDGLRIPLSEGSEESDAQITALAKVTADSMDVDLLRANVAPGAVTKDVRSIALLEMVLQHWGMADTTPITQVFRNLFAIRSTGSAHRRGSGYEAALLRAGLLDVNNKELVAVLLRRLTDALRALALEVRKRQPAA